VLAAALESGGDKLGPDAKRVGRELTILPE
jgi:hypothetical protein